MSFLDSVTRYLANVTAFQNVRFANIKSDGVIANSVTSAINFTTLGAGTAGAVVTFAAGYNEVTVCTAGDNSARLPLLTQSGTALIGAMVTINNKGATGMQVFPASATSSIDNAAVNIPSIIPAGCRQTFTLKSGTAATANVYQSIGAINWSSASQRIAIADQGGVTLAITAVQAGAAFTVATQGTGNVIFGLPPAKNLPTGARYRFYLSGTATEDIVFTPSALAADLDTIFGPLEGKTPAVANANVSVTIKSTAIIGASLELVCNGVGGANTWFCQGIGESTAVSFTAP